MLYLSSGAGGVAVVGALYYRSVALEQIAAVVAFLLAVVVIALMWGRGSAVAAALASTILFTYLFAPPVFAFSLPTSEQAFLLAALLAVAFGLGTLTDRMRASKGELRDGAGTERLQKTLLTSISHDLKTPLTSVIGSLGTLLAEGRSLEEHSRQDLLAIAYQEAHQLDRLVAQLLEMMRVEAGMVPVRRKPGDLAEVIRGAVTQLPEVPHGRRCRIKLPQGLPMIPLDPGLVSRALLNILDNAAKYSPPEAVIDVDGRQEDGWIILSVADRGIGVPAAELGRIFEKFYRIHEALPPGGSVAGLGLGLPIAKRIVEAHGGQIWAEQRDGGGTVVRVKLPLH